MSRKKKVRLSEKQPPPVLVLIGTQASGKGTQAALLSKKFGFTVFEMGQSLRLEKKKPTKLGRLIKSRIDNGYLVPSWVARETFKKKMPALRNKPLIIDGAPRQVVEARYHESTLRQYGRKISLVIFIKINEKEGLKRLLLRGREDDTPQSIRRRFAWSRAKLKTILKYFKNKYPVEIVNGEQTIKKVHQDMVKVLKKHAIIK